MGTNNIPLLTRDGAFGNRCINDAAAARYIKTCKESYLDSIFNKEDFENLIEQDFEGDIIEPKYFVPIIPLLVINGSVGVSTGFAQKILPRNPTEVIKYIEGKLQNKKVRCDLSPYFVGYKGTIKHIEGSSYLICGNLNKITNIKYEIDEIPHDYDLNKYVKILDQLVENKKIRKYQDFSNGNVFKFTILLPQDSPYINDQESFIRDLKLNRPITENYTSIDDDNTIQEYQNIEQILDQYIDIRLKYYQKRKDTTMRNMLNQLKMLCSKYVFVKEIIEGNIEIKKKTYKQIEDQLVKNEKIVKINDSYDYLLRIPLYSITEEKYISLSKEIQDLGDQYKKLTNTSINDIWLKDLNVLKKQIGNL